MDAQRHNCFGTHFLQLATVALLITVSSGCTHTVKIIPTPATSEILLDQNVAGQGVTSVKLKSKHLKYELTVVPPPGYFTKRTMLDFDSPKSIHVAAPKDHSYYDTVEGADVCNKWITLKVAKRYSDTEAWRKVMSSVSKAIADFETLDEKSLYLKSAWRVAGKRGDILRTRCRIIVAVEDPDPDSMTYKFRIESERIDARGDMIEKIPRTFRDYLDALETTRQRLIK